MTTHRLAVLAGDGIGPEVTAEACKVLDAVAEVEGFTTDRTPYDLGGRRFLETGEVLSDETLEELRSYAEALENSSIDRIKIEWTNEEDPTVQSA